MRVIWIFSIKNFILIAHSNRSRAFIESSCFVFFYFFPNNFINELCACSTHFFCLFVWLSHAFVQIVPNGTAITVSNLPLIFFYCVHFPLASAVQMEHFSSTTKKTSRFRWNINRFFFFQNYWLFHSDWFVWKFSYNSIGSKWFNGFVCINLNYTVSSIALRQSGLENERHCTCYNSNK